MARISQVAVVVLLALSASSPYADAFTFSPAHVGNNGVRSVPFLSGGIGIGMGTRSSATTPLFMASTITRLPDSAVEVTITAPGTATQAAFDKAVGELSREITIPGFRKGAKIPPAVLENAMAARGGRNAIRVQAINELAQLLIAPSLKDEHGLEPIGQPTLKVGAETLADNFKPGQDLEMVVQCDVWPDVQFKGGDDAKPYMGLSGRYKRKPFNQKKFDVALGDLMERYAELTPIADGAHKLGMGDACVVSMVGYMALPDGTTKGEPLPNAASGDHVEVVLGEGRYMEGLVEGLVGASVDDTVQVTVTFPVRLKDKQLAGKTAIFDVTVESASKRSLPELTDAFAENVRPGLTVETLNSELKKAIDEEDAKEFVGERNNALSKSLAEVMDVEVPDTLVTQQAREKYAQMMTEFRDQGTSDEEIKKLITPENFLKYKDIYAEDIRREFKVSMAVERIAIDENIEVPAYQVEEQIANLKKEQEDNEEQIDEAQLRGKVEATLQSRLVFDFLAENADLDVEYVEEDFEQQTLDQLAKDSLAREGLDPTEFEAIKDAEIVDEQGEADRIAAEEAEAVRVAEEAEAKAAVEAARVAAEKEAEAEAVRVAAEAKALAEAKAAEEAKAAAEAKAAEEAEAKAIADAKAAEEAKAAAEAKAIADAKAAEEAKAAAEAKAIADAKAAEEAAIRAAEEAIIQAEKDRVAAHANKIQARKDAIAKARQPKSEEEDKALAAKYGAMSLEDRAFAILLDLGMIEENPDPDSPDYWADDDDELCC